MECPHITIRDEGDTWLLLSWDAASLASAQPRTDKVFPDWVSAE
jgi:hypothetical protein